MDLKLKLDMKVEIRSSHSLPKQQNQLTHNNNTLISKVLDVSVFPIVHIHFLANSGRTPAVAISGHKSQNPGLINIANSVFGSKPPISDKILAKAIQADKKVIDRLQAQFWADP